MASTAEFRDAVQEMSGKNTRLFTCPNCGEQYVVDTEIQEMLLADGCIFCDATVSTSNFERPD